MKQYFDFVPSNDPDVEDDMYVLVTNREITIQVALYAGGYFVSNEFLEVGEAPTLKEAMAMAIAAQVLGEFESEITSALAH
jgi:hypothetical protein|tara:strand:- start:256 stop:498 length:243 start_codon:yes stop_codon:yes gene_type:complete